MRVRSFAIISMAALTIQASAGNHVWQVAMPTLNVDTHTSGHFPFSNGVLGPTFAVHSNAVRVLVIITGQYQASQRAEAYTSPFWYGNATSDVNVAWGLRGNSSFGSRSTTIAEFRPFPAIAQTTFGTSLYPLQTFSAQNMPHVIFDISSFTTEQKANMRLEIQSRANLTATGVGSNAQGTLTFLGIASYFTLEFDAAGNWLG